MSRLVLGTVQLGSVYGIGNEKGQPSPESVFRIFAMAYANGIRTLDTAPAYGAAQDLIGEFHRMNNVQFEVNTKFLLTGNSLKKSLRSALDKLNTPQIGVYFFHRFQDMTDNASLFDELQALKQNGAIREIGVSVYGNDEFRRSIDTPGIDVVQFPFNLFDNSSKRELIIKEALNAGKRVQSRSVFLQGLFLKNESLWPDKLAPLKKYQKHIAELAKKNGLSIYEMALGYVMSKETISEVIIGVDDEDQLAGNLRICSVPFDRSLGDLIDDIDVQENELLYPVNWK
jgi:uncharacterized protein